MYLQSVHSCLQQQRVIPSRTTHLYTAHSTWTRHIYALVSKQAITTDLLGLNIAQEEIPLPTCHPKNQSQATNSGSVGVGVG